MRAWIQFFLVGSIFAAGFTGCKKRTATPGSEPSMIVEPAGASPGMIVRVSGNKPLFRDSQTAKVEFGGQPASVARVVSDTEAEVLVPQVPPGKTTIGVSSGSSGGKDSASFTILPARAQQLVLKMTGGQIELVAVHPTSGEPSGRGELGGEAQLSFDVLNKEGSVVYTGIIPHPAQQGMEVFDGPDAKAAVIRREEMDQHEITFALKVPKLAAETTIKFFEAPPSVNIQDARGRESRKFLSEVKVPAGNE